MLKFEIFFNPGNEMVFERPFDGLVEKVRGEELINIRSWEVGREWLRSIISS
jgi:hypothetical protein